MHQKAGPGTRATNQHGTTFATVFELCSAVRLPPKIPLISMHTVEGLSISKQRLCEILMSKPGVRFIPLAADQ